MSHTIAIILGSFHKKEVSKMLASAQKAAAETGLSISQEIWVPGCIEKPLLADKLLQKNDIDAVVVLGIIERGQTKHGLVMGHSVTKSLIDLQIKHQKPIGLGIIGPEVLPEQINPRLESYGEKATKAVAQMLEIFSTL